MADEQAQVTVFRSPYHNAREEAERIREMLLEAGVEAIVVDGRTPGVVGGTIEVRVPERDAELAERIAAARKEEAETGATEVDPSHALDLETVFASGGAMAEMEALTVHSMLEAAGLAPVLVGASTIPSLSFEVRVPRAEAGRAAALIAEARQAGPQGAEEAEQAGEERPDLT
jgi:hypothetical protein